jgi:CHAT domain-containing protein
MRSRFAHVSFQLALVVGVVLALSLETSSAQDSRPTIDQLLDDKPFGGWETPEEIAKLPKKKGMTLKEIANALRKEGPSPLTEKEPTPFEAFLLSQVEPPIALKTRYDALGIAGSSPVAQVFLLANTGRIGAAAEGCRAYQASSISKRYQSDFFDNMMIHLYIAMNKTDEAEQLILWHTIPYKDKQKGLESARDYMRPKNTPPGKDPFAWDFDPELDGISNRIQDYGVRALLAGRADLFKRLADPVKAFVGDRSKTDPTGQALLTLGTIEIVEGDKAEGLRHLADGLSRSRDFQQRKWQHERSQYKNPEEAMPPEAAPTVLSISPAGFILPLILRSWQALPEYAEQDFKKEAWDHESTSGFSESFDVGVPSASGGYSFTRRAKLRRDAIYQLATLWNGDLAKPTLEHLLNMRRLRSRSFGRFSSRPHNDFDQVVTAMQGQAAGMHFVVHPKDTAVRSQRQADWIRERVSAGLREPVSDVYRQSCATRTISRVTADAPKWKSFADFAAALPDGAAALEIVKGQTVDLARLDRGFRLTPPCYGAWFFTKTAGPVFVDLGPAAELDALVYRLRRQMERSAAQNIGKEDPVVRQCFRQLSDKLLKPIEPHLAGVDHLIVCPDGELWLIPWVALSLQDGRPLLEQCAVSHRFTVGELVDPPVSPPENCDRGLIFADPDFNATPDEIRQAETSLLSSEQSDKMRIPVGDAKPLFSAFQRLPGMEREANAIVPLLKQLTGKDAYVYRGQQAIESLVKVLHSPEYLVFTTHGAFLPWDENSILRDGANPDDAKTSTNSSSGHGRRNPFAWIPDDLQALDMTDPLVRGVLILAGANQCHRWGEIRSSEGILSALEVSLLDLRGTKLVVLSACKTGLGDLRYGDGVSGLRQAFMMAGSQAVVASLWSVGDGSTADLMEDFFTNLAAGNAKHVALRKAQLAQRRKSQKRYGGDNPFYWAAFTVTGAS